MTTEAVADLFNSSLERCLRTPGFLDQFYELFLASSDEVAEKFKHTDFARQRKILKGSLYMLMLASFGVPEARQHLDRLAELHSRRQIDIRPELYDLWLECMLETVEAFDPRFDEPTAEAWRRVLAYGIDIMKSRY
ncbi:MAG TPA: globin [Planctomycetaceae bacterium]|nr:globin [Planctomycetaceae bacterium]